MNNSEQKKQAQWKTVQKLELKPGQEIEVFSKSSGRTIVRPQQGEQLTIEIREKNQQ